MSKKTTVLMVLDGYGLNKTTEGNAVNQADTKNIDYLMANYPYVEGHASGLDVGLPDGQMGNSEVGHLNIGAGRTVYQELTRITKSIKDGDFYDNVELNKAIEKCVENNSALHLYGLLSNGGVHSHNTHLYAIVRLAKKKGLEKVYVHCFLDGRDTPPASGKRFVEELDEELREIGVGKIATVMGRYYAMDRDNRWERVELAYDAIANGKGVLAESGVSAVQQSYEKDEFDEFVKPTVVTTEGQPTAVVSESDSIICFNFRPDRAREISRAFCMEEFDGFAREKGFMKLTYVCFTEYDITIPNKTVAFTKVGLINTMGEYISSLGLKQLRLAETEKYAHVTFFFNGGVEEPYEGEDRILINSPKVATYDMQPEMSAFEVKNALVESIKSEKYDLIIINFANPDMVGHTGILDAAIKAVETVDACVGEVYEALKEADAQMFICADHGNSEQLVDYVTHEPFTAHTINPVPFILVNAEESIKLAEGGKLADISPTLLDLMEIDQPAEMTGKSLVIRG